MPRGLVGQRKVQAAATTLFSRRITAPSCSGEFGKKMP
jgi:hypothetical protein